MRILHTTPKGLPDWRIERAAYIARNAGHEVHLLGMGSDRIPFLNVFESITMTRNINNRQAALDKSIRREWAEAVREVDPDLIHANDIIAAKFSSDLGIPMVYDDHEYWSAQRIIYTNWPLWKRIAIRPFLKAIPEWEREILSKHITLTVSDGIAEEHRRYCAHVFVLRNFSLKAEVENLPTNPERSGVVFVGNDFMRPRFAPHRNMEGLQESVKFHTLYGLPRNELYEKLTHYRFGLMPFMTTDYTQYISSTKTFDYLNCGLQVLMTRELFESHGCLPYCYCFDDYPDIPGTIESCERVDPAEIMKYANKNLIWEAQEDKLFKAYELCVTEM